MKAVMRVVLLVLASATATTAQERPVDDAARQTHKGSVKIWVGSALVVAGAIAVPVTATHASQQPSDFAVVAGVGLLGAGGALIWSGVQDQRRASQPQTTVRFAFGRASVVQVRRAW